MMKHVLIINITRMGDLVQTAPLLRRLEEESPGVSIDLVIDPRLAPMAALLPGLRHVHTYDFKHAFKHAPDDPQESVTLPPDIAAWARSLASVGYDRVINLTFTHWSGLLAAAIGVPDTRGMIVEQNGMPILLRNPWLAHVIDMQQARRFNRFSLVDLYALGGSGPGSFTPIRLVLPNEAEEWAERYLAQIGAGPILIAVQIGASQARKAWRPEYFGRTMAALDRRLKAAFVLTGTTREADLVKQAADAYYQAGGVGLLNDAVGRTDVFQLAALLSRSRLLLTNDTGPMHLAVGVGTPVIDLSVGHVDFHETGPYGPGHWVMQPLFDCAPCGYTQLCAHHSCKDQLIPDQVAALALHVLGPAPFPTVWTGVQVYESGIDEDGLACYQQRAGLSDHVADWYGTFWRRYWYEQFTDQVSRVAIEHGPPDFAEQQQCFDQLAPSLNRLVQHAEQLADLCREPAIAMSTLKAAQEELAVERRQTMAVAMASPAFGPITASLLRALYESRMLNAVARIDRQVQLYRKWKTQMVHVMKHLQQTQEPGGARHSSVLSRLPIGDVSK